jgi:hypothetical protein
MRQVLGLGWLGHVPSLKGATLAFWVYNVKLARLTFFFLTFTFLNGWMMCRLLKFFLNKMNRVSIQFLDTIDSQKIKFWVLESKNPILTYFYLKTIKNINK